jgi:hypothetical protein
VTRGDYWDGVATHQIFNTKQKVIRNALRRDSLHVVSTQHSNAEIT